MLRFYSALPMGAGATLVAPAACYLRGDKSVSGHRDLMTHFVSRVTFRPDGLR